MIINVLHKKSVIYLSYKVYDIIQVHQIEQH